MFHVAKDVLDDHDGVVNQHTQGEGQGKEDNHIEGDVEGVEDNEGQKHGEGDCQADQHGVSHAHDKKENDNDQDQAADNVVFQVGDHGPDVLGMVHQLAHLRPLGPGGHPLLNELVDLLGDVQHVFSGTLLDLDID